MICSTKHFFFNHQYKVYVDQNNIVIGKSKLEAKHLFPLSHKLWIKWVFNNRELAGFEIRLKKKWKQFDMDQDSCQKLRSLLAGQIPFSGIDNLYKRLDTIGIGSYSEVYLVRDLYEYKTYVAKKMTLDQKFVMEVLINQLKLFDNEVKALSILKHPKIPQLKEYYIEKNQCVIVTQQIEGETLSKYNRYHRKKNISEIKIIITELLKCLTFIHSKGFIHRDIKPENIMISGTSITLIDFGFATQLGKQTFTAGTPGYIAPEIFDNQPPTTKCDIFSAGAILYEIIYGHKLFEGETQFDIKIDNQNCQITLTQQEHPLHPLLAMMLEKDVDKRIDAQEGLNFLTNIL